MQGMRKLGTVALAAVLLLGCGATVGAKDIDSKCAWSGAAIKVDGKMGDWENVPTRYLEKEESVVGLANDSSNLYVMLRFRDPMYARTVHQSGITLYVDPNGKKKKDFELKFRGGPSFEEIRKLDTARAERRPEQDNPRFEDRMKRMDSLGVSQLVCTIKDRIEDKPLPLDGAEGPSAAAGVDSGFFVYEFKIPLRPSEVRDYGIGANPGGKISVGLVWGEFQRPERPEGGERGGMGGGMRPPGGGGDFGGGGPGGMGGRPGGMGGGMRGGMRGGEFKRPEKREVWLKATLASDVAPKSEAK